MELAEKCKRVRIKIGVSQKKLAELIGTNQTEISFIERGFIPKDTAKIEKIAALAELNNVI